MSTILITGAASGLGAAFAAALTRDPQNELVCVDIRPFDNTRANATSCIQVDISSEDSIAELSKQLAGRRIDTVIHCAGVRGLVAEIEQEMPDNVQACEMIEVMTAATMARTFQINAIGTFLLLRALLKNLSLAEHPKVVVMSSRMGSIGNNQHGNKAAGSAYAYRASKAAANAIVRSLAVDVPTVAFVLCHPGRVETNLVRCKEEGAITAEESVRSMLPLIDRWTSEDSGGFYDRFGERIEW